VSTSGEARQASVRMAFTFPCPCCGEQVLVVIEPPKPAKIIPYDSIPPEEAEALLHGGRRPPRATCRKVGKARIMLGGRVCEPIRPTYERVLSGWWPTVSPCEKPPGALA